jgi:Zn-dependent protease
MDILLLTLAIAGNSTVEVVFSFVQLMIILLFSLSFHEAAHAWAAYRSGDDTARLLGRMTLNPIPHIDPVGTLLMPGLMIAMSVMGGSVFLFGWAKPVPVNPLNFRDYRKGEMVTSLAGPFSNVILMTAGLLVCRLLVIIDPSESMVQGPFFGFFMLFSSLNCLLFVFNLIPVPPLDGSHVLKLFLSPSSRVKYERSIAPFGILIILGLAYLGVIGLAWRFIFDLVTKAAFIGV